jgi:hypothetical protein
MELEIEKGLNEIIGDIRCPKDFKCYKSGLEALCKAKDVGLQSCIVCDEEYPPKCCYSWDVGSEFYCTCPARIYIAKKFKK